MNPNMIESLNDALIGFKIDAKCIDARTHRHFGFYDLTLGPKCQVSKIVKMSAEIALKIRSQTVPIVKSITEQGIVRLQVVLKQPESLSFENLYKDAKKPSGLLPFLFGETDDGNFLWTDISQNPHMLVAGSTGSGKSVFLHNLIANAARTPNATLLLSDTKTVEFAPYRRKELQHFIPVIASSYNETVQMLENLVHEMEIRYSNLLSLGLQSIEQMRSPFDKIIVIIDEVADLILSDGRSHKFEELVVKLAQKSRAAGIYLVLATQRPSVDVLTGLIKANFEARLSCKVSNRVDSGVILDHAGAEHLMGRGDAIFKNRVHNSVRFQVAYTKPENTIEYIIRNKH
jgi:S-DNA-T family DNA segregation ATPase FtsK/SpoIIIE